MTTDRILESWSETTSVAVQGRDILAIQDTSEIKSKTTAKNRRDLGEIGKGNIHGLLLHAMVAVDADTGHCLGWVDGDIRTRQGQRDTCHTDRPLADKETKPWVETARKGTAILSEARRITVLAEAERDIYAALVLIDREGPFVLTRSARDRRLRNGHSLYEEVASWPIGATDFLEIQAQSGRAARAAQVELRFGEVTLRRPDKTEPDMPEQCTLRVEEVANPIHQRRPNRLSGASSPHGRLACYPKPGRSSECTASAG
ncbi:hypothetical protein [Rhodospirillum sp. A1_3_36]|uniref:hypothetical protein n=1 Tax=Rhodospirillum sp. A1_3_36 TaxID=3391666 RepID=UPI0039A43D43